jgi:hypothetical protein
MNALDQQFHIAQNVLRGNTLSRQPAAQKAVAPIFYQLAVGDGAMYEIPTYIRNRISQYDFDNRCRAVAYADRVRAMLRSAA